jgi:choline dehydrogenase-like flavoprotein
MALNVVEAHVRETIAAQWPERCLTIGRTANLTEGKPDEERAPCQYRSICARGCSYGAYFSTQSSTLPAAMKTGRLTVITDAVVEALDHDAATGRITGVRYIDTKTKARKTATARFVFLNAGAFNSVHILLNSAPNGLANSSGVLGTHIMDHANTLSAAAIMPGFEGTPRSATAPPASSSRAIATWRRWTAWATRGLFLSGRRAASTWTQGKRMAGIGADYKRAAQAGAWRMVLVAFADCVPRATNRLTLDRAKTDAHGLPQLKVDFAFGKEEHAALAQAKAEAAEMLNGGRQAR